MLATPPKPGWRRSQTEPMSATEGRDAGYVLLYVAHSIEQEGRLPPNFSSHLFSPTGTPVDRVSLTRIGDTADVTGKRSLSAVFENAKADDEPFSLGDED